MKAASVAEKGIRPSMEDTCYLDMDFGGRGWVYAGIYDGHNGIQVARYAADHLHRLFLDGIIAGNTPQQAFIESYEKVTRQVRSQDIGATAVDAFIKDRRIFAANAGDAAGIVVGKKGFHQLTVEHRLDNHDERKRIEEIGAEISYPYTFRAGLGLMPTRSLGDDYFRPVGILTTPSVSEYEISGDDLTLLIACDGLFDFMAYEEVAEAAMHEPDVDRLVQELRNEVLIHRGGTDNLTIIAVSVQ